MKKTILLSFTHGLYTKKLRHILQFFINKLFFDYNCSMCKLNNKCFFLLLFEKLNLTTFTKFYLCILMKLNK